MSNDSPTPPLPTYIKAIIKSEERFKHIVEHHKYNLNYHEEAQFAKTQIAQTTKLQHCTPQSIHDSLLQAASLGLTLNHQKKLCYLTTRYNKELLALECKFDITYHGLYTLALETGVVQFVVAERVFESDIQNGGFEYLGPLLPPKHQTKNPFLSDKEKGNCIGVYCVAKLATNDYMTTFMTQAELNACAQQNGFNNSVWSGPFRGEMEKKACIKRAFKLWPKYQDKSGRFSNAVELMNRDIDTINP
ncbi:recombinase RecT [Spartinivicinus marinus]|uniref:recombinase RecT n=1 Tax=Spartinivicinus marinus TaxID=2994442 RepID=UPI002256C956|nr:recombinase RecT [Spartinivicinus marinus]MCX4030391.1 recombinase RecT [Spartinivicinus marinus]